MKNYLVIFIIAIVSSVCTLIIYKLLFDDDKIYTPDIKEESDNDNISRINELPVEPAKTKEPVKPIELKKLGPANSPAKLSAINYKDATYYQKYNTGHCDFLYKQKPLFRWFNKKVSSGEILKGSGYIEIGFGKGSYSQNVVMDKIQYLDDGNEKSLFEGHTSGTGQTSPIYFKASVLEFIERDGPDEYYYDPNYEGKRIKSKAIFQLKVVERNLINDEGAVNYYTLGDFNYTGELICYTWDEEGKMPNNMGY